MIHSVFAAIISSAECSGHSNNLGVLLCTHVASLEALAAVVLSVATWRARCTSRYEQSNSCLERVLCQPALANSEFIYCVKSIEAIHEVVSLMLVSGRRPGMAVVCGPSAPGMRLFATAAGEVLRPGPS